MAHLFFCLFFGGGGAFQQKAAFSKDSCNYCYLGFTAGFYLGRAKEGISMGGFGPGKRAERFGYITTLEPKREDLGVK